MRGHAPRAVEGAGPYGVRDCPIVGANFVRPLATSLSSRADQGGAEGGGIHPYVVLIRRAITDRPYKSRFN